MLFGSLLVFFGFLVFSWNYLVKMRNDVFSDMKISMMDKPVVEEIKKVEENVEQSSSSDVQNVEEIDYSKYFGVLEIPKIYLKRGFYYFDSRYNNIKYNVTLVNGSDLPDVYHGNMILMAHSGDSYISYFAYLYKLNVGDDCYVTCNGNRYHYRIVNIYDTPKNGIVSINRNRNANTLTMITCTKDSDVLQTVYIAELVE